MELKKKWLFKGDLQNRILFKNELHHRYFPTKSRNFKDI